MTDLLTTRQVQDILRVDRTTIYRMVEGGQLPAIRVGKQWRFARSEVEHWLREGHSYPPAAALTAGAPAPVEARVENDLASVLPLSCTQLIQDAFADMLGVTMIITDMQGRPVTQMSNPCEFFTFLIRRNPEAIRNCVVTWQQMAGSPSLEPRFIVNEMGLLCARGLIRMGAELKGSVVIGGIAPDDWPPSSEQIDELGALFAVPAADVARCVDAVYRLDRATQERALRYVQRIADIFSHILEDRTQLLSATQAVSIARSAIALTSGSHNGG